MTVFIKLSNHTRLIPGFCIYYIEDVIILIFLIEQNYFNPIFEYKKFNSDKFEQSEQNHKLSIRMQLTKNRFLLRKPHRAS